MDAIADQRAEPDRPTFSDIEAAASEPEGQARGEGGSPWGSPYLTLEGFAGPLDHLLTLARAQTIDLADISLTALLDQLATALRQAPAAVPLGQKADWVVMAAKRFTVKHPRWEPYA